MPSSLSAHPTLSIPALVAFQLHPDNWYQAAGGGDVGAEREEKRASGGLRGAWDVLGDLPSDASDDSDDEAA